MFKTNMECLS